ncbi:MAG: three-Cys-motif partner protein TcmP, partial [Gammaproteobacteria bacterium]
MTVPKTTTWSADDHTRVKHAIVKGYLGAWYAILLSGWPRIVYFDGFAGPGQYEGGEDGSPIVALKTFRDHQAQNAGEVVCILVEKDRSRFEHLSRRIAALGDLPASIRAYPFHGRFEDFADRLMGHPDLYGLGESPTFVFIDPFGFAGLPMDILARVVAPNGSEVFVTFMIQAIEPRLTHPDEEITQHLDQMFGTTEWRDLVAVEPPAARRRLLHDLYVRQLRERARLPYHRRFEMLGERRRSIYTLIFGSRNEQGVRKMKEAMWKAHPGGGCRFSDATDPDQLVVFTDEPDFDQLRRLVVERFGGREVSIEEVLRYVNLETGFRDDGHVKKPVLAPLEREGLLEVTSSSRKKRFSYP